MKIVFTICSNNYLAQAAVLRKSVLKYEPGYDFFTGLVDLVLPDFDYSNNGRILPAAELEPEIYALARKYTIVELNTAIKPTYFEYFLNLPGVTEVIYLDPDTVLFSDLSSLSTQLLQDDILLTPHLLQPVPDDHKKPFENEFLNFGIYNLGFLAVKNTANVMAMIQWWKSRTYNYGYHNLARGLFVDQLWMNFAPVFFSNVHILNDPGYNMGPWNLNERTIEEDNGRYMVNGSSRLIFYHFSSFNPITNYALHHIYDRYKLDERPDLVDFYNEYADALMGFGFADSRKIKCHYIEWRKEQDEIDRKAKYKALPIGSKVAKGVKRMIPEPFKKLLISVIQS